MARHLKAVSLAGYEFFDVRKETLDKARSTIRRQAPGVARHHHRRNRGRLLIHAADWAIGEADLVIEAAVEERGVSARSSPTFVPS
jgi:3-hydroxyacyl-CoA dehydrogenase